MKLTYSRGFTLVELLIALTVLGTLLAIAWPSAQGTRARWAVRAAGDAFVARHSMARAIAVRYGRVAELHIDAAAGRVWAEVDTSATGSGVKDTVGPVLDLSDDFGVTTTSTGSVLCFDGRGMSTERAGCDADGVTLTFALQGHVDTVTTSAVGKVLR